MTREKLRAKARAQMTPSAHVVRLVLDPGDRSAGSVRLERFGDEIGRQRVKLLDANDRDVFSRKLFATREEFVIDLTAAQEDAVDLGGSDAGVSDYAPETI